MYARRMGPARLITQCRSAAFTAPPRKLLEFGFRPFSFPLVEKVAVRENRNIWAVLCVASEESEAIAEKMYLGVSDKLENLEGLRDFELEILKKAAKYVGHCDAQGIPPRYSSFCYGRSVLFPNCVLEKIRAYAQTQLDQESSSSLSVNSI